MSRPSRPPRFRLAALACAAVLIGFAVPVSGALAETPLEAYQRTGQVPRCPSNVSVPNDVEQYAPDFLEALRDAQRNCGAAAGNSSTTTPTETDATGAPVAPGGGQLPPGSTYVPKPPAPPKPFRDGSAVTRHLPLSAPADTNTPAPVLALALMAILLVVGGALAATWRYMGWGLGWLDPVRRRT
jgi:hypothetical protein